MTVPAVRQLRGRLAAGQLRRVRAQLGALHLRGGRPGHGDVADDRLPRRPRLRQAPQGVARAVRGHAVPAEHPRHGVPARPAAGPVRHAAGLHPDHGVGRRRGSAARGRLPQPPINT